MLSLTSCSVNGIGPAITEKISAELSPYLKAITFIALTILSGFVLCYSLYMNSRSKQKNNLIAKDMQTLKQELKALKDDFDELDKQKTIQIIVKRQFGKDLNLTFQKKDTVLSVKQMIQNKIGMPPGKQSLIFAGKSLKEDDKSLKDCSINDGSMLVLFQMVSGD